MPKIDDNNHYVVLGQVEGANTIQPLKVDPVTGLLLVKIYSVASTTPVLNTTGYDENNTSIAFASDGASAKPFLIDSRNGYLWCDVG